jgi:high-affinity iron transporter
MKSALKLEGRRVEVNNVHFRIYIETGHEFPFPPACRAAAPMLLCSALAQAEAPADATKALHLLDYIGADYPPTVRDGKVVDSGEYREQQEFSGVLAELVKGLPDNPERAALEQGVQGLRQAIEQRQEGAGVARQARQLGARLAVAYEVSQAPIITPDPARGAALYAQNCSICHGDTGLATARPAWAWSRHRPTCATLRGWTS